MPPPLRGLYAITPDDLDDAALFAAVDALLAGGCRWLQYRDKTASPARRREKAIALRERCRRQRAALIVNDDVELALHIGADGVHLGRDDGDIATARRRLGPEAIVGASCYADLALARAMTQAGASYVAFGAVYPSPTKPEAAQASLELLSLARRALTTPICAIGGITLKNAPPLLAAGADLLAVISDLFSTPPAALAQKARAYCSLFTDEDFPAS